jgi:hypothetical protein
MFGFAGLLFFTALLSGVVIVANQKGAVSKKLEASYGECLVTSCNNNVLTKCENGKITWINDCGAWGLTCRADTMYPDCYQTYSVTHTRCEDTNVVLCRANEPCKIKYVCQNGCTPSDYQATGKLGKDAKCISTYNRFYKCSPDLTKILRCDGTYCTTVVKECGEYSYCVGEGTDVSCI